MKKKWFTREEKAAKEMMAKLSRRQFLSYGIKSSATLAIPGLLSGLLRETTAFAAVLDRGQPQIPVVQIHTSGGPLEYVVPRLANGDVLGSNLLGAYGVNPSMVTSVPAGTVDLMGLSWFNRSRTGVDDFIVSLRNQALLNASPVNFNQVHAYNIASDSDDDDATGEHNCNNVLTASGFKGRLTDALDVTGGLRANQALKFAFNPFAASGPVQIQNLVHYAPAFNVTGVDLQPGLRTLTSSLETLSEVQSQKLFKSLTEEEQAKIREGLAGSLKENKNNIDPLRFGTDLNIRNDADYAGAFNNVVLNTAMTAASDIETYATGLDAVMRGLTNFMGYTWRQGMDYHQNTAFNGDGSGTLERDAAVGRLIGATINIAFKKSKDLIIVLTKDGCCRGNPDHTANIVATGDNGERTSQIVIFVNGAGSSIPVTRLKQQIGNRRPDSGQVDTSVLVSKSDAHCASAIGAAILYLNGVPISDIRKVFPIFDSDADVLNAIAFRV